MGRWLHAGVMTLSVLILPPAAAQDIPGLEGCMAEKQMERRTGCLQSNDDFLQQTILKLRRDMQARLAASGRDLATAQAEIAALKSAVEKLNSELAQLKAKVEATGKK
jgi:multidrug resistance efflux pump